MTLLVTDEGIAQISTSIFLPRDLIVKARLLKINRSALFREALQAEIARLTNDKAEAPKIDVQKASATPYKEAHNGSPDSS